MLPAAASTSHIVFSSFPPPSSTLSFTSSHSLAPQPEKHPPFWRTRAVSRYIMMRAAATSGTGCGSGCGVFHQNNHRSVVKGLLKKSAANTRDNGARVPLATVRGTRKAVRTGAAKDGLLLELVQALGEMGSKKIQKDFNELVVEPFSVRAAAGERSTALLVTPLSSKCLAN